MRAFVVVGRGQGEVAEVDTPLPGRDEVVVTVARAGLCGTDVGIFYGDDERLAAARLTHPVRLGHEWCGTVTGTGSGVDLSWLNRRVTADTMIGCGQCAQCQRGRHQVCPERFEIGVRRDRPGALAEQVAVPARGLVELPAQVDDAMGAMVEPGGNAWRAAAAAAAGETQRVLVVGPGTIGLLTAQILRSRGLDVHVLGPAENSLTLARELGFSASADVEDVARQGWEAVVDATDSAQVPELALRLVAPAGRVVLVGVAETPSRLDTRIAVRKEVDLVSILGASAGLAPVVELYARGLVDPTPLVSQVVGLEELAPLLGGWGRRPGRSRPKVLVDPALR